MKSISPFYSVQRVIYIENDMKDIPYDSSVGSLIYAQMSTRPDIVYVVGLLGRYQSNSGMEHWKLAFKVQDIFRDRTLKYHII